MFSSFKLATAALFAALLATFLVSASPIVEQRAPTCKPNFEGNRQTIYHTSTVYRTVNEWTAYPTYGSHITLTAQGAPGAIARGEFFVPFSGEAIGTYHFKLVADTQRQFALTVGKYGELEFLIASGAPILSQVFYIDCETCPTPGSGQTVGLGAQNCVIRHPSSNKCFSGSLAGQTIRLATCDGSADQKYNFYSGN